MELGKSRARPGRKARRLPDFKDGEGPGGFRGEVLDLEEESGGEAEALRWSWGWVGEGEDCFFRIFGVILARWDAILVTPY
jgi:hypothetical protein